MSTATKTLQATLATSDTRYYGERGFDPRGKRYRQDPIATETP